MKNRLKTLDFNGTGIVFTADGWLNATATAQALGKDRLDNFLTSAAYLEYAAVVADACSLDLRELKKTVVGKGKPQGTYLHPELVVLFARWISPAFAYWCDKQVSALIRQEQEAPARNEAMRTKRLQGLGRSENCIAARNDGVTLRVAFTNRLKGHGVRGEGYRSCTRAIYQPMFGGGTAEIRTKYGIPENGNVRDYMEVTQLSAISLAEALSAEKIEKHGIYGNMACEQVCNDVGRVVARMVTDARKLLS